MARHDAVWVLRIGSRDAVAERAERNASGAWSVSAHVAGANDDLARLLREIRARSPESQPLVVVVDPAATTRVVQLPIATQRAVSRRDLGELLRWELTPWVPGAQDGDVVCTARPVPPMAGTGGLHAWVATGVARARRDEIRRIAGAASVRLAGVVSPATAAASLVTSGARTTVLVTGDGRTRAVRVEYGVPTADRERIGSASDLADVVVGDASEIVLIEGEATVEGDARDDADAAGASVHLGVPCTRAEPVACGVARLFGDSTLLMAPATDPPPPLMRRPAVPVLAAAMLAATGWMLGDSLISERETRDAAVGRARDEIAAVRGEIAGAKSALTAVQTSERFLVREVAGRRTSITALLAALRAQCAGRARLRQVSDADGGAFVISGAADDAVAAQAVHRDVAAALAAHGYLPGDFSVRREAGAEGGAYQFSGRLVPGAGAGR